MYTIDFETYYDKQFSLSKLTTEQYIRDERFEVIGVAVKHNDGPTVFHAADSADWKTSIQQALNQYHFENEVVIAHNAVFDMAILNWHFGIKPKFIVDTLSMARPLTMMTVGGSLRALSELFNIGHKGTAVYDMLGKHRTDMTDEDIKDYGEYCKLDVDLTYQLFHKLKVYSTPSEMFVIDCLMRMFTEPMLVLDKDLLRKHLETVQNRNSNLLKETGLESRDDLMSNPKFAELLKSMGVTPPMKISERTGKETYAFSKKDLEFTALLEHPDDRVQALVAARLGLKSTIEETRTEMFLGIAERGGLPIMLNYYGGHTGRASGADKVNLQNLPRGGALRKAMRAPTGYCLCVSDSSQIEARTLAWFAGQTDLVDEFKHGVDVYSSFATTVYGYQVTKKEHPVERHVGKTCLAGNTLVLTDKGYKLITDVTEKDRLWDGFDWVKHDGVVPMGEKKVVQFAGLRATKDHMIFTGYDTWVEWQQFIEDKDVRKKALASANLPIEAFALQPWLRKRRLWTQTFIEPVYDIANAGPRHRFTVLTDRGPLIVHNCILGLGYGTGASKLQHALATSNPKVELDDAEAKRIVSLYRKRYACIPRLWQAGDYLLQALYEGYEAKLGVGVQLTAKDNKIQLPNGMFINYNNLTKRENPFNGKVEFCYYNKKLPKGIYGAKVVENVVQALARIVVFDQMVVIDRWLRQKTAADGIARRVVLTVHDEVVVCVPDNEKEETLKLMMDTMKVPPPWASSLPVSCDGDIGYTYGDAK